MGVGNSKRLQSQNLVNLLISIIGSHECEKQTCGVKEITESKPYELLISIISLQECENRHVGYNEQIPLKENSKQRRKK